jgi:hypothetical protein
MSRGRYSVIPGFAVLAVGVCTVSFTTGCGSEPVKYDETTLKAADQFRKVAVAYNQAAQKKRSGPVSAETLKPFLKEHGDPDAMLVSPLDGKPIVIVPGITASMEPADDEQMIVAYEQQGVNGKRMTVDIRGTVVIVEDDDFAKIKFVGGHKPAGR